MKVKLNKNEIQALQELLKETVKEYGDLKTNSLLTPESLLQKVMLEEFWIYIAKKCFEIKQQYTLDFKPRWALAFFIEYIGRFEANSFTGNLIIQLCNSIHKNYVI